jgi:hypothetical protein
MFGVFLERAAVVTLEISRSEHRCCECVFPLPDRGNGGFQGGTRVVLPGG